MEKKYTKQEITELADKSYEHCSGCFKCEHYEPVNYTNSKSTAKILTDNKLFKCSNPGCYYACELPWSDEHWCWHHPAKDREEAKKLWLLTWDNLVKKSQSKTH